MMKQGLCILITLFVFSIGHAEQLTGLADDAAYLKYAKANPQAVVNTQDYNDAQGTLNISSVTITRGPKESVCHRIVAVKTGAVSYFCEKPRPNECYQNPACN